MPVAWKNRMLMGLFSIPRIVSYEGAGAITVDPSLASLERVSRTWRGVWVVAGS